MKLKLFILSLFLTLGTMFTYANSNAVNVKTTATKSEKAKVVAEIQKSNKVASKVIQQAGDIWIIIFEDGTVVIIFW